MFRYRPRGAAIPLIFQTVIIKQPKLSHMTNQQIDILTMIDPVEGASKKLFNGTCLLMYNLTKEGKTKEQVEAEVKKIELPLEMHLAIFGRFSETRIF